MDENPYQAPEGELAKASKPRKPTRSAALGCGCLFVGGIAWTVICFVAAIILDEQWYYRHESQSLRHVASILAVLSLAGVPAAIFGALGVLASFFR